MDQDRERNGEFGNKRYSDDGVELPVPDLPYLTTLRPPQNSVESSFLDAFCEDPTEELIEHWRNEVRNVDALESADPLHLLTPADRKQLVAFMNEVSRRRLRHKSRIDIEAWDPGDDVDTDEGVIVEAERAARDQVDMDSYEPGEDVDADEVVAAFIVAHRALTDSFPTRGADSAVDLPASISSRTAMDKWVPGDDVDGDNEVVWELAAAVGNRIDLDTYVPGDDADADDIVAVFIVAHRALVDEFPRE